MHPQPSIDTCLMLRPNHDLTHEAIWKTPMTHVLRRSVLQRRLAARFEWQQERNEARNDKQGA